MQSNRNEADLEEIRTDCLKEIERLAAKVKAAGEFPGTLQNMRAKWLAIQGSNDSEWMLLIVGEFIECLDCIINPAN